MLCGGSAVPQNNSTVAASVIAVNGAWMALKKCIVQNDLLELVTK